MGPVFTWCFGFCLQVLLGVYQVEAKVLECKEKVADVVFVLDSSDSIWPTDFTKQLDFVKKVVNTFTIGPNNIQVGVVTFATRIKPNFQLNTYDDKKQLLTAINSIDRVDGGTNTGAAIQYVRQEMFKGKNGARKWAAKIVVLITDGFSQDTRKTLLEASIAHSYDIKVFAIGVGGGVDSQELDGIASEPTEQHIFRVENYKALNHIKHSFTGITCDIPVNDQAPNDKPGVGDPDDPKTTCGGKPTDVLFLLDSSSSIWAPDFQKQLEFVRQVVDKFDLGTNKTRVGVITFSDGVHPVIPLDSYKQSEFDAKLMKIPYLTGGTSTSAAIQFVRRVGFAGDKSRPEVARVAIVITDGQSRNLFETVEESRKAHKEGIYVFAVGVGRDVDDEEMMSIASDPDENFVFRVDDYNGLAKIEKLLAVKTCGVQVNHVVLSDQPVCRINHLTDLVFVMDSSILGHDHTQIASKTIAKITSQFPSQIDINTGIVKEKCPDDGYLDLNSYHRTNWFINRLRTDDEAGLSPLLHHVRRHSFRTSNGARRDSEKIAVIFVDSELLKKDAAVLEARRLKFQNVKIYTIAIGATYSDRTLTELSSYPDDHYVIRFPSYEVMLQENRKITDRICQGA
ncbi:hypothetical protein SNE40_012649 [Patella caerulea]|uniref:VWFA domain-containing protein n=1 Tax=Patella caerulea TaxID=87958 RepID=A0AAN8PWD2_PATCE